MPLDRWRNYTGGKNIIGNGIKCFTSEKDYLRTVNFADTGFKCYLYFTAQHINQSITNNSYQIWETDGLTNSTKILISPQPCPEGFYCLAATATDNTTIDMLKGTLFF